MNKNIIVTGGAGFIGSNVVRYLNSKGYKAVTIVDHLRDNGKWRNLVGLEFQEYYDRQEFLELVEKRSLATPEVIIHLGACSDTTNTNEDYLLHNNTIYSRKLMEYCADKDINFIYASSAATYGDGSNGFDDTLFDLQPLNCYGYSKHLFDQWILSANKRPKYWVGLKFFNVYGPYESHKGKMASVVLHGYRQIVQEGKIKLFKSYNPKYKDGEQLRDFIYVKDVAKVIEHFINHPGQGIFNVGTGKSRSFLDLAKATFAALGIEPKVAADDAYIKLISLSAQYSISLRL